MDDREKRLIGDTDNKPSEAAIRAHQLGSNDEQRAKLLNKARQIAPSRARQIIEHYSRFGDVHQAAMKFDLNKNDIDKLLVSLGINSIEDARRFLSSKESMQQLNEAFQEHIAHMNAEAEAMKVAKEQLEKHVEQFDPEEQVSDEVKVAQARRALQEELDKKAQVEQTRLIQQELNELSKSVSKFRIPAANEAEFKRLVLGGIGSAQRRFGGTAREIRAEAKRLLPNIDVDLIP